MASFEFAVSGLDALVSRLEAAKSRFSEEVESELRIFAEEVMAASKEVVPVDTGTLMSTGHVQAPETKGNEVSVLLGYGGPAAPYALYVHEALEGAREPDPNWSWTKKAARGGKIAWTRPGSGPKYLERPFRNKQGELPGRVADAARRAVRGS